MAREYVGTWVCLAESISRHFMMRLPPDTSCIRDSTLDSPTPASVLAKDSACSTSLLSDILVTSVWRMLDLMITEGKIQLKHMQMGY